METIKQSGGYSIVKDERYFYVLNNDTPLKTPGGKVAYTIYLQVANMLMKDWMEQGYDSYTEASSLLSYHFTMVENFSRLSTRMIVDMLNSLNWENDKTFEPTTDKRIKCIRDWLNRCTHMQLVAATCVYNAFGSFNIAYVLASIVERIPEDKQEHTASDILDSATKFNIGLLYSREEKLEIFRRFKLYYGIHFVEDGPHV